MSRKRADRRTGGLFPDLERPTGERFAVKRINRVWTPAQEAVALAAVCASQSRAVYDVMVPHLMDAIGHAPVYPEKSNVSPRKHLENCTRALELRIVTKMIGGYDGWQAAPIIGFTSKFRDQKAPLTWAERCKIIKPWWKKERNSQEIIDIGMLHQLMGRDEHHGPSLVLEYIQELDAADGKVIDPEITPAPIPITIEWAPVIRMMLINLEQGLKEEINKKKWIELQSHFCKVLGVS